MPTVGPKPPDRGRELFENLFGHRDQQRALTQVSQGLEVIVGHSRALLEEVDVLVNARRFARARLLTAIASEELGKAHLLLDATRLDISTQEGALNRLCHAFYEHETKYAYMRCWRVSGPIARGLSGSGRRPPTIRRPPARRPSMASVGRDFDCDRVRWWPAGGTPDEPATEPDMPHDTYFDREMNLYVDYVTYNASWSVAGPSDHPSDFDDINGLRDVRAEAREQLGAFEVIQNGGALSPDSLKAFNSVWRGQYVVRQARDEDIVGLWYKAVEQVSRTSSCSSEQLLDSPLCLHPCYDLVVRSGSPF
jgi:hypothetical protein